MDAGPDAHSLTTSRRRVLSPRAAKRALRGPETVLRHSLLYASFRDIIAPILCI